MGCGGDGVCGCSGGYVLVDRVGGLVRSWSGVCGDGGLMWGMWEVGLRWGRWAGGR